MSEPSRARLAPFAAAVLFLLHGTAMAQATQNLKEVTVSSDRNGGYSPATGSTARCHCIPRIMLLEGVPGHTVELRQSALGVAPEALNARSDFLGQGHQSGKTAEDSRSHAKNRLSDPR